MGLTYADVISLRFGNDKFSAKEFGLATGSSRPAKLLYELKMRGIVERTERGKYRCLRHSEKPDLRSEEWNRVKKIIARSTLPGAYTDSSAVEIWTNGRYTTSPNPFMRVFHLAIYERDKEKWVTYLSNHGIALNHKKRVGACVTLVPLSNFRSVTIGKDRVVSRKEVLNIIRSHPGLYAGAERLIDY